MIGTILGNRYRIEERIGGGGMAVVFRATDLQLGREVAVKTLRGQFGADDEFVRRFRREAHNAASLSHPNIVQTYDVGEDGGVHYIVMELVTGKTLKALIQEQGPLPPGDAARIGIAIADALAHAHAQGIVHRDIKPHNILLGQDGRVKVADFGIARAVTTDTLTRTGSWMGSAHYFSPEQADGQPASAKSDLYSLGVVLYEMVTGTVPFQGESPITVALKHLRERVDPPSHLNPEVPVELDEIILRAMEKEPEDRFDSAVEMRDALADFLQLHLEGRTHMPSGDFPTMDVRAARARSAGQRRERGRAKRQRDPETARRRARIRNIVIVSAVVLVLLGGLGAGGWALWKFLDVPEVQVPPIVGVHITQAEEMLAAAKLQRAIVSERHSDLEQLYIIEARPEPGSWVKEGAVIELVVSKGPEIVELPDVVGMNLDQARARLKSERFGVGEIKEQISNRPAGEVIAQAPPARTPLKVGSTVTLTVSLGPLKVPDVAGMALDDARKAITDAGLVPGSVTERPDAQPAGTVLATVPAEGSQVEPGQRVDLVVSSGPELLGTEFSKELIVPGPSTQKVRFQVVLIDQIDGAEEPRVLVDEELEGGQRVVVSDKFYGSDAYLIISVNGVEAGWVELP
ncbi:Stk1 family PASTA domain-containing Ser/Thr kinase [Symbiobacterium thermophilum]|uniref:non-specific serine/threonine protein kinase n=2 Tax=Symbiobacterium thermophilum TaxID=2734 RepID=Q67PQ5_SYMTH|nr:Stk1 family PASTA domain-containing Ser/Thr kinase [Symbiobacterium thermophilum]BAD40338.1 serine/threonine protein kinase [Symbiobacterium thermophilum IAM 14863]